MINLKWPNIIIVFLLSLVLLFGGYFLYQKVNIQSPIESTISEIDGVQLNNIDISRSQISVNVTFNNPKNFKKAYLDIEDKLNSFVNDKKNMKIDIDNDLSETSLLNKSWDESYFSIAQAIEKNEYQLIPQTIQALKGKLKLTKAISMMDEKQVYIELQKGKDAMYVVLPTNEGVVLGN